MTASIALSLPQLPVTSGNGVRLAGTWVIQIELTMAPIGTGWGGVGRLDKALKDVLGSWHTPPASPIPGLVRGDLSVTKHGGIGGTGRHRRDIGATRRVQTCLDTTGWDGFKDPLKDMRLGVEGVQSSLFASASSSRMGSG
jgi:hypothetical protein